MKPYFNMPPCPFCQTVSSFGVQVCLPCRATIHYGTTDLQIHNLRIGAIVLSAILAIQTPIGFRIWAFALVTIFVMVFGRKYLDKINKNKVTFRR